MSVETEIQTLTEAVEALTEVVGFKQAQLDETVLAVQRSAAEVAAVTGFLYDTVALGLSATAPGQQFRVRSMDADIGSYRYVHEDDGSATLLEAIPSAGIMADVVAAVEEIDMEAVAEVKGARDAAIAAASTAASDANSQIAPNVAAAVAAKDAAEAARDANWDAGVIKYWPADATALSAITGMVAGDLAFRRSPTPERIFRYSGTSWEDKGEAPSAKKANRGEVTPLINGVNLFNAETIMDGYRANGTGQPTNSAGISNPGDFYLSDFIEIFPGQTYAHTPHVVGKTMAFYRRDKSFISVVTRVDGFTAPADAYFCRINPRKSEIPVDQFVLVQGTALPSGPQAWVGNMPPREKSRNKPGGFVGLSPAGFIPLGIVPHAASRNIFNPSDITPGVYISDTGLPTTGVSFYTTGFIPVVPGGEYHFSSVGVDKWVTFWDASKTLLIGLLRRGVVTAPVGASFMRISPRYSETPVETFMVSEGPLPEVYQSWNGDQLEAQSRKNLPFGYAGLDGEGKLPQHLLPATGSSPWQGKVIAGLGDSITYGYIPRNAPNHPGKLTSYLHVAASRLGMISYNHGISGSTVANDGVSNPMCLRYDALPDAADIVTVMGGTNDIRKGRPLGDISSTSDSTYYGALKVLAEGLLQKYRYAPGLSVGVQKTIVFCTPIRLLREATGTDWPGFEAFAQAVRDVAALYALPVFDAWNMSTLTPALFRTVQGTNPGASGIYNPYVVDGVHPTAEGHQIMGRALAGFLRTLA